MNVFAHPDPVVLEGELLRRVRVAQSASPFARVLVLVPTARLARHVTRRIAEADGARLAVEVTHHRALLFRVLEEAAATVVTPLSSVLLGSVVERVLHSIPRHPWSRFVQDRPGAIRAVTATLTDLREAGISPAQVREALAAGAATDALHEVFERYEAALDALRARGLVDEAGLVQLALPHVAGWAAGCAAVLHHGAYELIGVHLDLVQALDRAAPVDFLLPGREYAPAFETAIAFARRHLLAAGEPLHSLAVGAGAAQPSLAAREQGCVGADRLAALYDEAGRAEPLPTGTLVTRHLQGVAAEITHAARNALATIAAGTRPHEVAIVARSLDSIAAEVAATLDGEGFPWSGSAAFPLRRDPAVRDLLLFLRVVADDFPRQATCELLASPRIRWEALLTGAAPPQDDLVRSFSIEAGVTQGYLEWTEDLPIWAEHVLALESASPDSPEGRKHFAKRRAEAARLIASAIVAIRGAIDPRAAFDWATHADAVAAIARRCLLGFESEPPSPAAARLFELFEEMRRLTLIDDRKPEIPFDAMVAWLERAVDETDLPASEAEDGGIQVLDAMQARGLTFGTVLLVGVHGGSFPRASRSDPLLDDRTRQRLRDVTGRPIPVKAEADREERILLALVLGAARETLQVSWQRADEAGRVRPLSLALREIARLVLGEADLDRLVRDVALRIPAHPEAQLRALASEPGLLSPSEALLLLGLSANDAAHARGALSALRPDLLPRLLMLEAVESFAAKQVQYDGIVGNVATPAPALGVGSMHTLGDCPLRFFFRHVLRAEPVRADVGPFDFDRTETGIWVHDALRRVYARLAQDGLLEPERVADAVARAREVVDASFAEAVGGLGLRIRRRAPVFWAAFAGTWIDRITRFVARDLARLAGEGLKVVDLEAARERALRLDDGSDLTIRGRLDRIARSPERTLVGDYKTSRALKDLVNQNAMLRGEQLQVPLYAFLEAGAAVEILSVRADPRWVADEDPEAEYRFDGWRDGCEAGFRETLVVLADLTRAGAYPLHSEARRCARCPYEGACRHDHPPTISRMDHLAASAAGFGDVPRRIRRYYRLEEKSASNPSFAALDARAGGTRS